MSVKDLYVFAVAPDESDEEIHGYVRTMNDLRRTGRPMHLVCTISGFNDDPRELFDIPEAVALCRRLVELGFISGLNVCTSLPPCPDHERLHGLWGAFEVWLCSEGLMRANPWTIAVEAFRSLFDEFTKLLKQCNAVADAVPDGPRCEPKDVRSFLGN